MKKWNWVVGLMLGMMLVTSIYADGIFSILKVNRLEKEWVIPPRRLNFLGSRGLEKFDYQRKLPPEERGEHYIITWTYRGEEINKSVILRFEYRYEKEMFIPYMEEYKMNRIKPGTYKWVFKNIGDNYRKKGRIDRWKVSIIVEDKIVAVKKSATWTSMEGNDEDK